MGIFERERDEYKKHLSNLLACIHRDGGQYEASVGTDKAVEDADKIIVQHRREIVDITYRAEKAEEERDHFVEKVHRLRTELAHRDRPMVT